MRKAMLFLLTLLTLPAYAFELKPFTASYTADWKQMPISGNASRSLKALGDGRWQLDFEASMLLASLNEVSTFKVENDTFLPQTYRFARQGLGKGKQIAAPVVFQGGVSKNAGVVQAFRDELGMDVVVDEDGHLMGAFGVALLAAEAAPRAGEPGGGEAFDFDALRTFEFVTREVECQKCANHCEIICVYRDGKIIDSWGNRCDKGAVKAG